MMPFLIEFRRMCTMPKRIDPEFRVRAVRLVREHAGQYQNITVASLVVAKQLGVSRESVRRWVAQAGVSAGERLGVTSEEREEICRLKVENRRLRGDVAVLKAATSFFVGELDPFGPMIIGVIDTMRSEGHGVETVCRVLRERGCQVAARTYRAWRSAHGRVAARTITDALV